MSLGLESVNPSLERPPPEECLATFWTQATPGTSYWRCLVPARHLPGQALQFEADDLKDGDPPYLLRQRGAAVWQFLGDAMRSRVALGMRELHGTRTLLEVDDNYTRVAPYMRSRRFVAPWKETIAEAGSGYSHEMHRKVAPMVDGIICSTPYLADIYSEYHPDVYVCPNSVDPADWEFDRTEPDGVFRIVYYGSPSHEQDAPLVTRALKWAARQPNVEVWTVGFKVPAWSFPHQVMPWMPSLEEARKSLFRFDLGIAPLKGNKWSRGKSDIKAMEYAMAGVLPLMSNETPFVDWVYEWPNLVLNDPDWESSIRYWVDNRDLVTETASHVRDWVIETRSIEQTIGAWREAING